MAMSSAANDSAIGQPVGQQHQAEGGQRQRCAQQQGLALGHRAARDGAVRGAAYMQVELGVGHVVHGAAGRAHEDGAEREYRQQRPAGKAARRHPQRRQRGPQQQQPTGWAIPADEVEPELEAVSHGAMILRAEHRPKLAADAASSFQQGAQHPG
jgi:hypothetical protein